MRIFQKSDAFFLLAFFLALSALGALLLSLPGAWAGPGRLKPLDAFFTAVASSCVAGLAVVDLSQFSRWGHIVILVLIQLGGLGIISSTSLLLLIPGSRLALARRDTIRGFYLDGVEYRPRRIVRNIVLWTLGIELAGAVLLAGFFRAAGRGDWLFMGVFHAVSSFCNTGLSPLPGGLAAAGDHKPFLSVMLALILCGGIGFIVLHDLARVLRGRKKHLSYHSRVVLAMSGGLLAGGALLFFLIERQRLYAALSPGDAVFAAIFQSIATRSAGFEILPQRALSHPSRLLTGLLMLIGGAPGSIAGGLKVTTVFVIAMVMIRKPDKFGDIKVSRHRLTAETINKAVVYFLKAIVLLLVCAAALSFTEGFAGADAGSMFFEVISAFGTVGLSLGLTPALSLGGKIVIIAAMLAGRVGLFALAFPAKGQKNYDITYPEGAVLLG
jgi:trk system potassium uptake protein TrkH